MNLNSIQIYTDGSCHTQLKLGAWAAILLVDKNTVEIKGVEENTTHNRMELLAVLKALDYITETLEFDGIQVFSDSQYVVDIQKRKEKLLRSDFLTQSGLPIQNIDLVKKLIFFMNEYSIEFYKVKAHQKETLSINYNREVDKLVRKLLRNEVEKLQF